MKTRIDLHNTLKKITPNVYFQPPSNISLKYPAIIYSLSNITDRSANNGKYIRDKSYKITVIDKNPDSLLVEKVSYLPLCKFESTFITDGFNHTVFIKYN